MPTVPTNPPSPATHHHYHPHAPPPPSYGREDRSLMRRLNTTTTTTATTTTNHDSNATKANCINNNASNANQSSTSSSSNMSVIDHTHHTHHAQQQRHHERMMKMRSTSPAPPVSGNGLSTSLRGTTTPMKDGGNNGSVASLPQYFAAENSKMGGSAMPLRKWFSRSPSQSNFCLGQTNNNRYRRRRRNHRQSQRNGMLFAVFVVVILLGSTGYFWRKRSASSEASTMALDGTTLDRSRSHAKNSAKTNENSSSNRDIYHTDKVARPASDSSKGSHKSKNVVAVPPLHGSFGGAVNPGYFRREDTFSEDGKSFHFAAITDLDKLSKVEAAQPGGKPYFRALILPGTLHRHAGPLPRHQRRRSNVASDAAAEHYSIEWAADGPRELRTTLNQNGRGAEYSELTLFDSRLLTVDDRTGAVVELLNAPDGQSTRPVTRYVLPEGSGEESDKGMKWEWATVKDDQLYIGGIGKEMQHANGDVDTEDALWIAIIDRSGSVRRENWARQYNFLRAFLGCQLPGYLAHEALEWSDHLRQWVVLPRRISQHQYVPDLDERLGSNKILLVDENFTQAHVLEVDLPKPEEDPDAGLRGFSSFAFVPRSHDQHVAALRSVEENCVPSAAARAVNASCHFRTYISVFELQTGDLLMEETLIPNHPVKFEGMAFVDLFTKPPPLPAVDTD